MRYNILRCTWWLGLSFLLSFSGRLFVLQWEDVLTAKGQGGGTQVYIPNVVYSDPIADYVAQVDQDRIQEVTRTLVVDYPPRHKDFVQVFKNEQCVLGDKEYPNNNLIRASKYIVSIYQGLNYPFYKEWVDNPDWPNTYNVVAKKIGSVYPDVFIDVGAHIDTRDKTPGASDNATGVAAVVEIARVLQNYPNRYSWRFISFIGEEYGFIGSRYHINQVIENGEQIRAGLIMDGIGWSEIAPRYMNCLWDDSDPENREISNLFKDVRDRYGLNIAWRLCSLDAGTWSDNGAYWEKGYTAVASIGGLPYGGYLHQCEDNMQHVNIQNATLTAMENLAVLLTLDREEYQPSESRDPSQFEVIPGDAISH